MPALPTAECVLQLCDHMTSNAHLIVRLRPQWLRGKMNAGHNRLMVTLISNAAQHIDRRKFFPTRNDE